MIGEGRQRRALRVAGTAAVLLLLLTGGLLLSEIGLGIPCVFQKLTGWACPGCGVTRMGLALLAGDLPAAFRCNPMVFLLIPAMSVLFIRISLRYIRTGSKRLTPIENRAVWVFIACLVVFGILRNITGF